MKKIYGMTSLLAVTLLFGFYGCASNSGQIATAKIHSEKKTNESFEFHNEIEILEEGTDGTGGKAARYVYFGDWPQTIKNADVAIDESKKITIGAFTYYQGSDKNYYVKKVEEGYSPEVKYSNGLVPGSDSEKKENFFKVEPIKWRVLTKNFKDSGNALLVAENIIAAGVPYFEYNDDDKSRSIDGEGKIFQNNYKYSQIRAFLNGLDFVDESNKKSSAYTNAGFLQTAFTKKGISKISDTLVDNSGASAVDSDGSLDENERFACADTTDKVFLLSEKEVTDKSFGFDSYEKSGENSSRIRKVTDFAKSERAYENNYENVNLGGWWWLRSPAYDTNVARNVFDDGDSAIATGTYSGEIGVVPAICVPSQYFD